MSELSDISIDLLYCHLCTERFDDRNEFLEHIHSDEHARMRAHFIKVYELTTQILGQRSHNSERAIGHCYGIGLSNYCNLCSTKICVHPLLEHRRSAHHNALKHFLHSKCLRCKMSFQVPIEYDDHLVSPKHLRKLTRALLQVPKSLPEPLPKSLPEPLPELLPKPNQFPWLPVKPQRSQNKQAMAKPHSTTSQSKLYWKMETTDSGRHTTEIINLTLDADNTSAPLPHEIETETETKTKTDIQTQTDNDNDIVNINENEFELKQNNLGIQNFFKNLSEPYKRSCIKLGEHIYMEEGFTENQSSGEHAKDNAEASITGKLLETDENRIEGVENCLEASIMKKLLSQHLVQVSDEDADDEDADDDDEDADADLNGVRPCKWLNRFGLSKEVSAADAEDVESSESESGVYWEAEAQSNVVAPADQQELAKQNKSQIDEKLIDKDAECNIS